jgi:uncharacterized membrane protein YtjA (UPF0391 family)
MPEYLADSQIPVEGTELKRDVVTATHADYEAMKLENDFHQAAYSGGGGFAPDYQPWTTDDVPWDKDTFDDYFNGKPDFDETYLEPNLREGKKFERRLRRSWYNNVIKPSIRKIAGFLMKIPPERSGIPTETDAWLDSVSMSGLSMNRWLESELIPWFLTYGDPAALLDRPGSDALTRLQQDQNEDNRLTVGIIHPSSILDWYQASNGSYEWLKYLEILDAPRGPLEESPGKLYRYRWITQEGWFYVDDLQDGTDTDTLPVVKSGLWKQNQQGESQAELLNGAPLALGRLGENGDSYIKDAAPAARAQFNNASRRDNLLKETDFPMITMGGQSSPDDGPLVVGPNEILEYDPEAKHPPDWLSPDAGPFDTHKEIDEDLTNIIKAMLGFTIGSAGTTGVAKSFDMVELTRLLVSLASDCAEFELQILQIAAAMHNEKWPDNATSTWNTEFDAVDLDKLVDSLTSLLNIGLGQTADRLMMQRVTRAALPNVGSEDWDDIKKEQAILVQEEDNADDEIPEVDPEAEIEEDVETEPPIERPDAQSR